MTKTEILARIMQLIGVGDIDNADEYLFTAVVDFDLTHDEVMGVVNAVEDHNDRMRLVDTIRNNSLLVIVV